MDDYFLITQSHLQATSYCMLGGLFYSSDNARVRMRINARFASSRCCLSGGFHARTIKLYRFVWPAVRSVVARYTFPSMGTALMNSAFRRIRKGLTPSRELAGCSDVQGNNLRGDTEPLKQDSDWWVTNRRVVFFSLSPFPHTSFKKNLF